MKPLPHQKGSQTSAMSANANAKSLRESLDQLVLDIIKNAGASGQTVDEVRETCEAHNSRRYERTTIGSRITEGKNDGIFFIAPFRRLSPMGQEVNVYVHISHMRTQGELKL